MYRLTINGIETKYELRIDGTLADVRNRAALHLRSLPKRWTCVKGRLWYGRNKSMRIDELADGVVDENYTPLSTPEMTRLVCENTMRD